MNSAPRETYVHIVESEAAPGGIGEPGLPAIAPALCNADFCSDRQAHPGIAADQGWPRVASRDQSCPKLRERLFLPT